MGTSRPTRESLPPSMLLLACSIRYNLLKVRPDHRPDHGALSHAVTVYMQK